MTSPSDPMPPPPPDALKAADELFDAVGRCNPAATFLPASVLLAMDAYRAATGGGGKAG